MALAVSAAGAARPAWAGHLYHLTDLGTLGGKNSIGWGVNDSGQNWRCRSTSIRSRRLVESLMTFRCSSMAPWPFVRLRYPMIVLSSTNGITSYSG
jgi:hypothetical protein